MPAGSGWDLVRRRYTMNAKMDNAMSTTGTAVAIAIVVVLLWPVGAGEPVPVAGAVCSLPGTTPVGAAPGLDGVESMSNEVLPLCRTTTTAFAQILVNA